MNTLKYGLNPDQRAWYAFEGDPFFTVTHGEPGYINMLDALGAWQCVRELKESTGLKSSASFKHCSPAGVGVHEELCESYVRARGADPKSSFGDFVALSDPLDLKTAQKIKSQVCDGIICPGGEEKALELVKSKKKGKFIVIKVDSTKDPKTFDQTRIICGVILKQETSKKVFDANLPLDVKVAAIACKYCQSNSVAFVNGPYMGLAAGGQNRVDILKLAQEKYKMSALRHHPYVLNLPFKSCFPKQDKVNIVTDYLEGKNVQDSMEYKVESLSDDDIKTYLDDLGPVSIASDAFFPFPDAIEAIDVSVKYLIQPSGALRDQEVEKICKAKDITRFLIDFRTFMH